MSAEEDYRCDRCGYPILAHDISPVEIRCPRRDWEDDWEESKMRMKDDLQLLEEISWLMQHDWPRLFTIIQNAQNSHKPHFSFWGPFQ